MGPVRRRLIAALALLPQAALADVCTDIRPDWSADHGPVTGGAETLFILTSPMGIGLILLLALAMVFPLRWLALVAALPTLAVAGVLFIGRQADMATTAMATGCIGSALPAVILLVLASAMVLVRGFRR